MSEVEKLARKLSTYRLGENQSRELGITEAKAISERVVSLGYLPVEPAQLKVLSWEGIRIVLQEQGKKGVRDNMFTLEALSQATIAENEAKGKLYRVRKER